MADEEVYYKSPGTQGILHLARSFVPLCVRSLVPSFLPFLRSFVLSFVPLFLCLFVRSSAFILSFTFRTWWSTRRLAVRHSRFKKLPFSSSYNQKKGKAKNNDVGSGLRDKITALKYQYCSIKLGAIVTSQWKVYAQNFIEFLFRPRNTDHAPLTRHHPSILWSSP